MMGYLEKATALDEITQDVLGTTYEELRALLNRGFLNAATLNRYLQVAGSRIVLEAVSKKVIE